MKRHIAGLALILGVAACASSSDETVRTTGTGGLTTAGTVVPNRGPLTTAADRDGAASAAAELARAGDRVFFALDRSDLGGEAQATLRRQAEWLSRNPAVAVVIEGHADERGTREYNLALGERRATAVRNFLTAAGIPGNRIRTVSFGKEKPAIIGSTESAWAQNRRAVTTVE
ncbi:MAG TPA: peptidoglycan-associated lipoprotein Pal [Stellaceae bacterium]|jgi:peptidoglycan-associated lipoprotein